MTEPYEVTVDDVFVLTGGGVAVVGAHRGGVITSGDSATLRDEAGDVPVTEVIVQFHSPPGRQALLLRGVTRDQVRQGAWLIGPRVRNGVSVAVRRGRRT